MSEQYAREILRRNVAQICQIIGWNGINTTPLDILVQVLEKYILTLGTQVNRYAEQFNRTEPNLNDLALVFRDLHIQLPELAEYTRCVPSVPPPVCAEKFPIPKESSLNFLKPGSHEVVTRPMHVHEHLPPMYPEKEQDTPVVAGTVEIRQNGIENEESTATCISPETSSATESTDKPKDPFKRPTDPVSMPSKRPRLRLDEEERTREISSVMMTMSGFLSPAREGKLPEARPPMAVTEKHDKHKTVSHHSSLKVPSLEKGDKKSKKNKTLNGKVVKNKRKDKSHKSDSSRHKDSKSNKHPPGNLMKAKDSHSVHNQVPMPAKSTMSPKAAMGPPPAPVPEVIKPVVKQEPVDTHITSISSPIPSPSHFINKSVPAAEEAIPIPKKIPISKSPLTPNTIPLNKNPSLNLAVGETEIKKEIIDEEEKLASQPDRSKLNIFKRISNKSKEDKNASELVSEKPTAAHSTKSHENVHGNSSQNLNENVKVKSEDSYVNNNNGNAVDLSKEMDLRAHEVIDVDDDSLDKNPPIAANTNIERPSISVNKSLQIPCSKDVARTSPKIKKEKKHKDKKDKTAKLEAKLLKKQQQQLAYEMAQAEKHMKLTSAKPPKSSRPKAESKMPQMPPGYSFFSAMPPGRNMMPGPGLIPNPGLIPGNDFFAGLANNPALRGLPSSNLLSNPFALNASGPGLIPSGTAFMPGNLASGIGSPLMHMSNFPHTSRSSSVKIPPMLRRPSLEVIAVDNDDNRDFNKSLGRDKDRQDKHKPMTIPNILQKHKSKYKDNKMNTYKMPPVQPDITIELNPPKMEPIRQEPVKEPLVVPERSPTPELKPQLLPLKQPESTIESPKLLPAATPTEEVTDNIDKKKDKTHKKIKKDKEGKIKKKKDKKDKTKEKEKSERKKLKEERHELKEKIKKEKKEKKKEKLLEKTDGLVPKLTLKLGSSNSNSPMPPSSPDVFKLNIKPVVKKDEEENTSVKEEPASREHSRSPELAQISALVTRPPKQKHSKQNHVGEAEAPSPPPITGSPPRKNRPPSSYSKYKRILFKPLSKKGHFEDETGSISEESTTVPAPAKPVDKVAGQLPTPYYVDEQGNKVWVCPACGRPDNGSPMIGCDGCDGWYHWVCVGITEEPGASEDWFCKSCLAKRTAMELAGVTTSGKKRGRKPKAEKIRDCH